MSIPNISNEQKMAVKVKSLKWGMIKPEQILWSKNPGELQKTPLGSPPSSLFYLFFSSVFLLFLSSSASQPYPVQSAPPESRPLESPLCPKNQLLTIMSSPGKNVGKGKEIK